MAEYHVEIAKSKEDGKIYWQATFHNEVGKENNAETAHVIGVMQKLAHALQMLENTTSSPLE